MIKTITLTLVLLASSWFVRADDSSPAPLSSPAAASVPANRKEAIKYHKEQGAAFYNKGKFREAISSWEEVLKLSPDDAYAQKSIKRTEARLAPARSSVREPLVTVQMAAAPSATPVPEPAPTPASPSTTGATTSAPEPVVPAVTAPAAPASDAASISPAVRPIRVVGTLELFTLDKAADHWERSFEDIVDTLGAGTGPTTGDFESTSGFGARVAVFRRMGAFEVGPSLGYVVGPSGEGTATTTVPAVGTFETTDNTDSHFVRALVEGGWTRRVSLRSAIRLGAGLGYAWGRLEREIDYSDATHADVSADGDWNGFTWEVSPAVQFDLPPVNVELGVRYAQFPTKSAEGSLTRTEWNPFIFYAAVGF